MKKDMRNPAVALTAMLEGTGDRSMEATKEEKAAIAALKRLAKKWPETLWLFAAANTLTVMKKNDDGKRAMTHLNCFDSENAVAAINIECDGGDF